MGKISFLNIFVKQFKIPKSIWEQARFFHLCTPLEGTGENIEDFVLGAWAQAEFERERG